MKHGLRDKDIREPLFDFLEETYGKVRILEEKTMGKSRADVVMVTPDALYGIEIKSDADTYARLERQIKDYNIYYDYNYVAVGASHGLPAQALQEPGSELEEKDKYFMEAGAGPYTGTERTSQI